MDKVYYLYWIYSDTCNAVEVIVDLTIHYLN